MRKRNILTLGTSLLSVIATAATVISCRKLTKEQVEAQTKITLKNKYGELFEFNWENVRSRMDISLPKGWKTQITSINTNDGDVKIVLELTNKNTKYTFRKIINVSNIYDKYLKLVLKDENGKEIKPDDYKNYFADSLGVSNVNVMSTNSNYKYEVKFTTSDPHNGIFKIILLLKTKDGKEIAKYEKTISGFKSKLPEDENDAIVKILYLNYWYLNAGDIRKEDILFKSKSGKYKYEFVKLEANDKIGELIVTYKQLSLEDGSEIAQFQQKLTGFSPITGPVLYDIKEVINNIHKSDYKNYSSTEIVNKSPSLKSDSNKYEYKIEKIIPNDAEGTTIFKLKWAIRNDTKFSKNTIDYVVSGFKKS